MPGMPKSEPGDYPCSEGATNASSCFVDPNSGFRSAFLICLTFVFVLNLGLPSVCGYRSTCRFTIATNSLHHLSGLTKVAGSVTADNQEWGWRRRLTGRLPCMAPPRHAHDRSSSGLPPCCSGLAVPYLFSTRDCPAVVVGSSAVVRRGRVNRGGWEGERRKDDGMRRRIPVVVGIRDRA